MTNGAMRIAPFREEFAGEKGFFYSFNVEVTGAARLYRAASVWTAGLGLVESVGGKAAGLNTQRWSFPFIR